MCGRDCANSLILKNKSLRTENILAKKRYIPGKKRYILTGKRNLLTGEVFYILLPGKVGLFHSFA